MILLLCSIFLRVSYHVILIVVLMSTDVNCMCVILHRRIFLDLKKCGSLNFKRKKKVISGFFFLSCKPNLTPPKADNRH